MTYLLLAILFLFCGHVLRAVRWSLLFPPESSVRSSNLLVALSLSYTLNLFVPFRLSEIIRVLYVSDRQKIRISPVVRSVLLERLSDCVVLIFIGCVLSWLVIGPNYIVPFYILLSITLVLLSFGILINKSRKARNIYWKMTWLFNEDIRVSLIEIAWTFSEGLVEGVLWRSRYIFLTLVMWTIYGLSYYCISLLYAELSAIEITRLIFESPQLFLTLPDTSINDKFTLILYISVPLIVAFTYAVLSDRSGFIRTLGHLFRKGLIFTSVNSVSVPASFKDYQDYSLFLRSLFQTKDSIMSHFGMRAIDDGVVNRIFNGGSGALIAQVQVKEEILIRKFAIDTAGAKLGHQAEWIRRHDCYLPMVSILNERKSDTWYYYDMPYKSAARDFYEFIHSDSHNRASFFIDDIVTSVQHFHAQTKCEKNADTALVTKYIQSKIWNNIEIIIEKVDPLISLPSFSVNGRTFDIDSWGFLKNLDYLLDVFSDREMSEVHGDLTIENVIIDMNPEKPDWFLIDPNPENIFNTPLIDWSKLFQSLHMGYEIANKGIACRILGNDIQFLSPRTLAYQNLYIHLKDRLANEYGENTLKQIYLHEIVNYLRLTPYKFHYGAESGMLFFGMTCQLIQEFRERYDIA